MAAAKTHPERAKTCGQKKAFLDAFARLGTVTHAAKIAKIGRARHNEWLHDDSEYSAQFEDAKVAAAEMLELEARKRAMRAEKPSDLLLIFLLKGAMPEKYRERYEVNTTGLTDEDLDVKIAEYIRKVGIAAFAGGEGKATGGQGAVAASA